MSLPTGSRPSGRANNELRAVELITGFTRHAEGSVLVRMGETHVLCNASVLERVPPFLQGQGKGWITAEYGMLPRATHTRSDREAARGRQGGRTLEIQRLIGRSLRAGFRLAALGERTIQLDCDVLQADGGTRCAAITGAWLATALAVCGLQERGLAREDAMITPLAAVSVGLMNDTLLLDLDYAEDAACDADMNWVMTPGGALIEVQATAEGAAFAPERLDEARRLAGQGVAELVLRQQQALAG